MVLELSPQQVHLLHATLAESIDQLRDEIVHTDERRLRDALKEKFDRLQALQRQVDALVPREQPSL
ncbi:hypothetical protein G4177_34110 [Corallococcus sp. ZKHCc1 1396]|uniref:Uncharacterized protein n=1 Tax=Corallococcus soli TaxID=2710757 RepID=A0ABR9PZ42_9BACT|nr:hypothetical protein [Corallococcus soli]MBE4753197.1 hypothetical protein [Corallococcus soli]RYZ45993.1 MAG: hypothetical protein EOO72_02960 [Myxococcaceae bacterium]